MKKIIFCAAVIAATVLGFSSCKKNQTPVTDTTKLWPAYDMSTQKYGFIDKSGSFKISPRFDEASNFFSCGYAIVKMDKSQCYIDKKGNIKFSIEDGDLRPFYYNYAVVEKKTKTDTHSTYLYGMVDKKFNYTIQTTKKYLGSMTYDGLVLAKEDKDSKYGYVNAKGKTQIQPVYEDALSFCDGYAAVSVDNKNWGLIDKNGKTVVQPSYIYMRTLGNKRWAAFTSENECFMIDAKGGIKGTFTNLTGSDDNEGIYTAQNKSEKYGAVDGDGKQLVDYIYDRMDDFCEGYCAAYTEGSEKTTMYLIDKNGKVAFADDDFSAYTQMHNGLILVYKGKYENSAYTMTFKWVDKSGKTIYSWTISKGIGAPARKAAKAEKEAWASEPYFVLGE